MQLHESLFSDGFSITQYDKLCHLFTFIGVEYIARIIDIRIKPTLNPLMYNLKIPIPIMHFRKTKLTIYGKDWFIKLFLCVLKKTMVISFYKILLVRK